MRNISLKWIAGAAFTISQSVSAAPITDVVVVGNQEWAQVSLFTNNSWNAINTQCPAGVCGHTSSVNEWDLDGWTWASIDAVQGLFNAFSGSTGTAPTTFFEKAGAGIWCFVATHFCGPHSQRFFV